MILHKNIIVELFLSKFLKGGGSEAPNQNTIFQKVWVFSKKVHEQNVLRNRFYIRIVYWFYIFVINFKFRGPPII